MAKTTTYKGFSIGNRVIIKSIANPDCENVRPYIGQHGYVKSITKTRNMIWVFCDNAVKGYENSHLWGAYPENLIHE